MADAPDGASIPWQVCLLDHRLREIKADPALRPLFDAHDRAYTVGGTAAQKLLADARLFLSMYAAKVDPDYCRAIFTAVYAFGSHRWAWPAHPPDAPGVQAP